MIEYKIFKNVNTAKKELSLITDKLFDQIFTKNNIYINGKLKTHSGIINKESMLITDSTSNSDSYINIKLDGHVNTYFLVITKKVSTKTVINVFPNTKRLRAQIIIVNNCNFELNIELKNINILSPNSYIKSHDFVILDSVCIDNICTGTYEKQPLNDINKNEKLNSLDQDYFKKILSKLEVGTIQNIPHNHDITNSILMFKNNVFQISEDTLTATIFMCNNKSAEIHMNKYVNIEIHIEHENPGIITFFNKTKRGFITIRNKTKSVIDLSLGNHIVHQSFTSNPHSLTINPFYTIVLSCKPFENILYIVSTTKETDLQNVNDITKDTTISEIKSETICNGILLL